MKKVNLGIIGVGTVFTKKHLPALLNLKSRFDIKYVYTSKRKKFKDIQATYENVQWCRYIENVLRQKDIDTIVACVPLPKHLEIISKVIGHKKNLIIEKPMVHSLAAAKKIINVVNQNNVHMMVSENFRYLSTVEKLKKIIDQKVLGGINLVRINAFTNLNDKSPYYHTNWRMNPRAYPGILWEGGIHFVSVLRYLFDRVEWKFRKLSSINRKLGKYDTVLAYARIKKNLDALITISYSIDKQEEAFLTVDGKNGSAQCGMSFLKVQCNGIKKQYNYKFDEYEKIYKEFHALVSDNKIPRYSVQDAYCDIKMLDKLLN